MTLEEHVSSFARLVRANFAAEIEANPKVFKQRVVTLLRRALPPFAGRPREESITKAAELKRQGLDWKDIYPLVIPGHGRLDPWVRMQAESNLRAAIRSRRNARRRRKTPERSIAGTNGPHDVPL